LEISVVYLTIVGGNLEIYAYYTMKCGMWVGKGLLAEVLRQAGIEKDEWEQL